MSAPEESPTPDDTLPPYWPTVFATMKRAVESADPTEAQTIAEGAAMLVTARRTYEHARSTYEGLVTFLANRAGAPMRGP